jgi:hypothetical protein
MGVDTSEGDASSGHVYVADRGNNRIDVFDPTGNFLFAFGWGVADGTTNSLQTCTATCFRGIPGFGAGQFSGVLGLSVAVDNHESSPSFHDIYVFDSGNHRVQKFSPSGGFLLQFGSAGTGGGQFSALNSAIAVGPDGSVFVGDCQGGVTCEQEHPSGEARIEKFSPAGAFVEAIDLSTPDSVNGLAVDPAENLYVGYNRAQGIFKYDSSGQLLDNLGPPNFSTAPSVDAEGNLFVVQAFSHFIAITEYGPSGVIMRRFGYGELATSSIGSLAPYHTANGDIFVTESSGPVRYLSFPPEGPVVATPALGAAPIGNTKATLNAEINPEGAATSYRFEYVDQQGFEEQGDSFVGPHTKATPLSPLASGAADFELHPADAQIGCTNPAVEAPEGKCLTPETTYHIQVVASNTEGTVEAAAQFKTKPAVEFELWSAGVGTEGATLAAEVEPNGLPTVGFFEYVPDGTFQQSGFAGASRAPLGEELDFGSGEAAVIRSVPISGLLPRTPYHFRLVISDPLIEPIASESQTFFTYSLVGGEACSENEMFRVGLSSTLPDCRAYEMVSPLDKDGGDIIALPETTTHLPSTLDQSSVSGDKLAYGSYRAFGDAKSAPYTSQYIAVRGAEGWQSHGISPPRTTLDVKTSVVASLDTEFKRFSPDLCQMWLRSLSEPLLAPGAVALYPNLYREADAQAGCGDTAEASTMVKPPSTLPEEYFPLELQGATEDGAVTVYAANDNLTSDASPQPVGCEAGQPQAGSACNMRLYAQARGAAEPRFVCVLPTGTAFNGNNCQAGFPGDRAGRMRTSNTASALSDDGSRLFWTAYALDGGATGDPGEIYLRINPTAKQSPVSGGICTNPARACTIAISEAAESASGAKGVSTFWGASPDGSRAIFSTGGRVAEGLYEASILEEGGHTVSQSHLIAHEVSGVMGASDDARLVYFASKEAIGGPNSEGKSAQAGEQNLYLYDANSDSITFVAHLATADVELGKFSFFGPFAVTKSPRLRDSRVSSDGEHAAFVSFGRPTGYDNVDAESGEADAEVYLYNAENEKLDCVSCNPSGGRPTGADITRINRGETGEFWAAATLGPWENNFYAPKNLSEDGKRLFFEAADSLSPRDTNGQLDVYEWEQLGTGGCSEVSSDFYDRNDGCVALISSGKSTQESEFIDATPDGHDVFFATLESLLPQDPGSVDIYDARVGGGLPAPPAPPAQCEEDLCQRPVPAPEERSPATSIQRAPEGAPPSRCPKGKRKVKKHGKARCVEKRHQTTGPVHHKKRAKGNSKHGKNGRSVR